MPEPCSRRNPRWLMAEEVTERPGVSPEALAAWRKGGQGPFRVQIGEEACYGEDSLIRWTNKPPGWQFGLRR